ncbi:polymorphic toxin-type HINT domain-containing protein [Plantactinospora sp. KBS50]|uniref:polymorphic toxin-type HINT domain-containing protein n=1 Tax=Plantactinospora sp. KBS50 TaxID=2024580 RepID=UPI0018DF5437|nr:polymorphic toxin-type HINT domain-containing protein [Plantactinospora sp. KBS50]
MALSYSSSAVDGRSDASNNQPSWLGEGFEYSPGFVERRYVSCAEDTGNGATNDDQVGDLCWGTDNAVLSLNGSSTELVRDGASGTWRLKDDDASKVEKLTGASNGDNNGEHWKVTTSDGTQYFFGLDDLPGQSAATNSTNKVRVYGNHSGEPCYNASFAAAHCDQAWRWNLDYVVDTHGGTMSYWYSKETNKYAANVTDSDDVTYDRASTLSRIDYGTWDRGASDRSVTPVAQVLFTTADRCLSSCTDHDNWPDVPWDQECTGSDCVGQYWPTFWSKRRLTKISTRVAGVSGDVESWTLAQNFPPNGDGSRDGMWLESIQHTGLVGGSTSVPEVNFDWVQRPNRVDQTDDGKPPMYWMRLATIWTETGGKISVVYSNPQCVKGSTMPSSAQTNTLRCYPVLSEDPYTKQTVTEYFNTYVVNQVIESDWTGGATDVITSYEYLDGAAWRHADDDGLTKDKFRTWSDYRGYGRVRVRKGTDGQETLTETRYYRGMHGDRQAPSGGTRTVTLAAVDLNGDGDTVDVADAPQVNDDNALAGQVREQTVYNGVDTAVVSRSVSQGWQSAATATRDMGDTTTYARYTGTQTSWGAVKLDAGRGWRVSRQDNTFDAYGMVASTTDQGDLAKSDDQTCTKSSYVRNTGANLLSLVNRIEVYALACGTNPSTAADVISDTRTSYDALAFGASPTRGDATKVETLKDWTAGGGTTWLTAGTSSYDAHGRPTAVTDVRGNTTSTTYTPTLGGPVTAVSTTNPLGWVESKELSAALGVPTRVRDVNNKITDLRYDGLGRLTKVWLPNRSIGIDPANPTSTPSIEYVYDIRNSGGVNAVTTRTINAAGNYLTTYALYDGLLRARQTQTAAASGGGTVFVDTGYDAAGRVAYTTGNQRNPNLTPSTSLSPVPEWEATSETANEYDRAGRLTASVFKSGGQEVWRTSTGYGGDRTYVTPPQGGTPTTAISDVRGNTIEVRQHSAASTGGAYDASTYTYNRKNQLVGVTDPAGNTWTYGYDIRGRQTSSDDPDKGPSTSSFNDYGDLVASTDARGNTLVYDYDSLGRKRGLYDGSVAAANKRATWTYDPSGAKGQLASSSRWTGAGANEYRTTITGYNALYQPTGEAYIIPAAETGVSGTYTFSRSYKADGVSVGAIRYPDNDGLLYEQVSYTYDSVTGLADKVETTWTGATRYVSKTEYTAYGELGLLKFQQSDQNFLQRAWTYDDPTRRVTRAETIRQLAPQSVADVHYGYDPAGNITSIADQPAGGTTDNQCFGYDYARRLTQAWTPSSGDCQAAPSVSGLGGPAPYWHSWTFDPVGTSTGNRATQIQHGAVTTETTYAYPTAGADRPHAVTAAATTGAGAGTKNYGYDAAGNTTCRPSPAVVANSCPTGTGSQALTWDSENKLSQLADDGKDNSYLYDANGSRLIARDPTGTTLYLPGTEIRYTTSTATKTATRYYSHLGQVFAQRKLDTEITWLVNDNQGTQQIAIQSGNQAVTQRRQTPYGEPRGTAPAWPNQLGFVGGTIDGTSDPTGLTNLGARPYDTVLGRFVAVDPLMDLADPEQWNGYAYANNSPVTSSDPSGLMAKEPGGGGNCDKACQDGREVYYASTGNGAGAGGGTKKAPVKRLQDFVFGVKAGADNYLYDRLLGAWMIVNHPVEALDSFVAETNYWQFEYGMANRNSATACVITGLCAIYKNLSEGNDFEAGYGAGQLSIDLLLAAVTEGAGEAAAAGGAARVASGVGRASRPVRIAVKCANSFAPATLVLMASGATKPIGDVQVGDKLLATDPEIGQTAAKTVTHLHRNHDTDLTDLTVQDGATGRTSVLHTTSHHPFWSVNRHAWVDAADLVADDQLLDADGRTTHTVAAVKSWTGLHWMYNLTVADIHTYYVIAGETPVLVHNCGPDDLVHVYRAPQRGNGPDELANGLNPARHREGNGNAYIGTEDVAQKYADYAVGTHEDGYIKFTFRRSEFEEHFGPGLKYEGGPGLEWEIPHGKIDLFNQLAQSREWLWAPW